MGGSGEAGSGPGVAPPASAPAPGVAGPAAARPAVPACHRGGLANRRRAGVTARNYEVATGAGSPIAA